MSDSQVPVSEALTDFCPGILHAVPARDGLLMRLRLPGGVLPAATLAGIAELARRHADGGLDLTARANIQLRGIRPEALAPLTAGLRLLGLLPSDAHERVRNILASPFAGVDPAERLDATPLAQALDRALIADPDLAALPPKFAFTLDGGGSAFDPGGTDLALVAVAADRLHLSLAGRPTGLGARPDQAVALLIRAAHGVLAVAREHGMPARGRSIVRSAPAFEDFRRRLDAVPCPTPGARPTAVPAGVLLPTIPFGRLDADEAIRLAETSDRFGVDMRLTPWRTLALRSVRNPAALDLPFEDGSGFAGVAACAGSAGCDAALADVRGDARRFARSVAGDRPPDGWRIQFAGCAKRCAMRAAATVDLIATQSGYDVLFDGIPVRTGLTPDAALAAARTAYRSKASVT